ncbi:penicillin-binding protein 2 [Sphingomonas oleivorans]|uniref:Penicillin-binding protein 2 n=1 Tax=Sphingomonas oleivorans TaxID=1735121 RepID=A0A2T5FX01_9SPHN|nr:penicillin-binding protein 2 [Sphingomonas oleivorans]PTQ10320.1 penicillin-binding protein 2 [Sphingomonas oleivorans]
MKRPSRLVTAQSQAFSFTRRAFVLGAAQGAVATLLAGRMAWLSIAENERYQMLSESNRVQLTLVPPRRGWIVDRHGKPIAINRTSFRVDLIPDRLRDPDRIIAELRQLLALTAEDVERIREGLAKAAGYQPVPVLENMDYERFAAVSVRQAELPGVAPASGNARYYPAGSAVGHLVGYVGPASAADYEKTRDPLFITPGFKVGKEGLEKTMEPWLRGTAGAKRTEVTARGRLVRELTTRPEVVGNTLQLTIDAGLQEYAARRLGDNSGSVVVIDTETGGILTMASMPAYDPNSFSDGISHSEWQMLSGNDHIPLMNKVMQGLYPPGSTVKPATALAVLEAGIDPAETVLCTGSYRLGTGLFHCHKRGGHGHLNLNGAIAQSCDIYFYTMGRRIGIDRIAAVARKLGLGSSFPLPVPSQRYGTVPDTEWKQRKYKADWTVADTLNATIGQGYMLANPLQLAVMAARIASGRALSPRLIANRRYPPQGDPLDIDPEHLAMIRQAMSDVVNGAGTAGRSRLPVEGVLMAGKTGTAQVRRITRAERARGGKFGGMGVPWKYRDHALFICFAPVENPRYAAAVVIEHGISGSGTAGPIARDVLTYLYDPAKAMATLAALEEEWGGDIATRMRVEADRWRAERSAPPPPAPVEASAPADKSASPTPAPGADSEPRE